LNRYKYCMYNMCILYLWLHKMEFEWDEEKDAENQKKHKISFAEAALIFQGPILTSIDDKEDYDEIRELSIGLIGSVAVIVVSHTDRDDVTRIISARKAEKPERRKYDEYCKKNT